HLPQWRLEQVARGEKLAVMDEQTTAQPPRQLVHQPPCRLARSVKLEDPDRHRRFLMKRDEPFLVGLAGWDAEPRRAIRVGVEAIHVKPTDLVPPGSTPARDQQCRPLVRALQRSNSVHEPGEFGLGDVAWHTAGPP